MFSVTVKTISRWADAGYIPSFRTPGGHRRFNNKDAHEALRTIHTRPRNT